MKKILKIVVILLAAALLLTSCKKDDPEIEETPSLPSEDETPVILETFTFSQEDFPRLDGSPGTAPLADALAAVMLGQSRDDVSHTFTRTSQAYRNLAGGLCDLILAGEPHPLVTSEISQQDFRYDAAPIAIDALVFIVSSSNPVDNLSSQQIKDIYSGNLTSWQDIGGGNFDIIPFQRNEEALSQVLMEKLVMDWGSVVDAPMQSIFASSFFDPELSPSAIRGFDGSAGAIGFTMYHYAAAMGMADGYKILTIDGVMPSFDTISGGDYPFVSPYYAVVNRDLTEDDNARILYNWLLSDDGQVFIKSQGYVPITDAPPLDDVEPVLPPQMRWTVTTDDSALTPYASPHFFTRLYNIALPELEPFDGYGLILPYATAVTMNNGNLIPTKYGFVTANSGTVITDPVYDVAQRAVYTTNAGSIVHTAPAYRLEIFEDDSNLGYKRIIAVCASDGSWITPFSYSNVTFRETVFFLMYEDDDSFNIDVYDYDGNLLYNMLDLDWADRISAETGSWQFVQSEGEGYGFIMLDDDTYAAMDVLTGEIRETDFVSVFTFSEDLACVSPRGANGLWGFANKDFELVIPAIYAGEAFFSDGRAVATTPDSRQHVIDTQGEVLYTVEENQIINTLPFNAGYRITQLDEPAYPRFLTWFFDDRDYTEDIEDYDPEASVTFLRGNWISFVSETGVRLFGQEGSYTLPPSVSRVLDIYDNVLIFEEYDSDSNSSRIGAATLSGDILIPASENQSLLLRATPDSILIIVNTDFTEGDIYNFTNETYASARYTLLQVLSEAHGYTEPEVTEILSGYGVLTYDDAAASDLIYVLGTDFFSFRNLTRSSAECFSIPSMAYTYD